MVQITVSAEQAKRIALANEAVEFRDPDGRILGYYTLAFTQEEIQEAIRRRDSEGPRYTTQQVLEHLHSLDVK